MSAVDDGTRPCSCGSPVCTGFRTIGVEGHYVPEGPAARAALVRDSAECRTCGGRIFTGGFISPDRSRWLHAMGVPEDAHQAVPATELESAARALRAAVADDLCSDEALTLATRRYWRAVDAAEEGS